MHPAILRQLLQMRRGVGRSGPGGRRKSPRPIPAAARRSVLATLVASANAGASMPSARYEAAMRWDRMAMSSAEAGGPHAVEPACAVWGWPSLMSDRICAQYGAGGAAAGAGFGQFLVFVTTGAAGHGAGGGDIGHHCHPNGLVMAADLLGRMVHGQAIDAVGHRQVAIFLQPVHQFADRDIALDSKPCRLGIAFKRWIGNLCQQASWPWRFRRSVRL